MTELESQAIEVMELIEDSVEYFCTENVISGEKVWTMVATQMLNSHNFLMLT